MKVFNEIYKRFPELQGKTWTHANCCGIRDCIAVFTLTSVNDTIRQPVMVFNPHTGEYITEGFL